MVKSIYSYGHYNSMSRLVQENDPSIESSYDSFHDRQCTLNEYNFAKMVWAKCGCKNGAENYKLYLSCYLLILSDIVFNNTHKIG